MFAFYAVEFSLDTTMKLLNLPIIAFLFFPLCGHAYIDTEKLKNLQTCVESEEDPEKWHVMGLIYARGKSVPQDDAKAMIWFHKAAEAGYVNAQSVLGYMHYNGRGTIVNGMEASKWFYRAGQQHFQMVLDFAKDEAEAVKWTFEDLADGYADAEADIQSTLAFIYGQGITIHSDRDEAVKWFVKAGHQNLYAPVELQSYYDEAAYDKIDITEGMPLTTIQNQPHYIKERLHKSAIRVFEHFRIR